ncbi:tRNA (adenosine(37)-N6)-dimethylallyltransferase MiaA [Magnetococcales bacterium HHB-1]
MSGKVQPLIFLMGPTASGKTSLCLQLSQSFPITVFNADSVQVYRQMDIGSAKPSLEEQREVPHILLDIADPETPFSAGDYANLAIPLIQHCYQEGRIPLFVGGSGLYFRAIEQGFSPIPKIPKIIVDDLYSQAEKEGWASLMEQLKQCDPKSYQKLHAQDKQRIIRALSVYQATGTPLTTWHEQHAELNNFTILKLSLNVPRHQLNQRIEKRFDKMVSQGLIDETHQLWKKKCARSLPAMKAVGYRQLFDYFDGHLSLDEAITQAKQETKRYAKRQLTWLRKEPGVIWFSPKDSKPLQNLVAYFLQNL